jgi:hypothetical protein
MNKPLIDEATTWMKLKSQKNKPINAVSRKTSGIVILAETLKPISNSMAKKIGEMARRA